jgi:hypothetical protein
LNVKKLLMLCLVWAAGCATTSATSKEVVSGGGSPEQAAAAKVHAALDAMPRCEAGANVGALVITATTCTKRFCNTACCNHCTWAASFEGKNGQPTPVEGARVVELLHVTDSSQDCEIAAWAGALQGTSLSVDAPGCVVR